jgi:AraC-like DNA-binding protein/mannose-6-phosphate isomerase-like protein (cupin superfamily)
MASDPERHRLRAPADRADILALQSAWGANVELMRTSFRTQVFPRHTHDYLTLGVILRGAGTIWCRGANRPTHPGDIVVIPPGEVHTGSVRRQSAPLSYVAVHIPGDVLTLYVDTEGLRGGRVPDFAPAVRRDPAIGTELRRLDSAMRRVDLATADHALSAALGLLMRHHAETAPSASGREPTPEPELVRVARDIIEDCYAGNARTSLRALALQTGVTSFHLVRVFTQTVGLSPHRYLIQTRIRRASEFLASGIPSSFVAAMTGFVDQSHLTTQFKRYVGTTPASYQRCVTLAR